MRMVAFLLVGCLCVSPLARADEPAAVHFVIDPARDAKPISRYIYGINRKLDGPYANLTFSRVGGNRWTTYNWTNNASNAGDDYHFQNDGYLGGGDTPGGAVLPALQNAADRKAAILLSIPINGYVSADKKGDGDVRRSGTHFLATRFHPEHARKDAPFTLAPDPQGAVVFQDEFVNWVMKRFPSGFSDPARPVWFSLDNEPDLWASTHKEVHPEPTTYAELAEKSIEYASAIKAVAPGTLVFGPANYRWQGFVQLQSAPDAGGRDFQAFYLQQMARAEKSRGKRLLDILDVHWYPEARGGAVRITGPEATAEVTAARVQAPRSLWDPQFTETSWIAQSATHGPIKLLARLREKIETNYPGTKLAVTEYNFGGGGDISGAIAQADVLGIFGREGVFAAAEWPLHGGEPFIAGGFATFRNFDGHDASFGDTSVFASTDDLAATSIYASTDAKDPHRLVVVAINKTGGPLRAGLDLRSVRAIKQLRVYQLTAAAPEPRSAADLAAGDLTAMRYVLPPFSVSTIEFTLP